MNFRHDLIDLPTINRVHKPSGRFYQTPEGLFYPSVTTVLSAMSDKSGLDDWVKRVGEEEARKQSTYAANRGNIVHDLCEQFVLNKPVNTAGTMPIPLSMFNQLKRQLVSNVTEIRGCELYLWSDKLKIAGATDLVASWKNSPAIIDFKTSGKPKKLEWIDGYFLQTALYSYALWERTGFMYNKLVVLISVEMAKEAQVFIQDTRDWLPRAANMCKEYHKRFT